jgi:hypothetical protein
MTYLRKARLVVYRSKDGKETKVFDFLEWLAAMCSHVPDKGEQMVRYYGFYNNGDLPAQSKPVLSPTKLEF